ncbi:iron complex transport system ATP-binding protein [Kineosphaera limosa]|uniref:Putative iron-siderophore ABC transporter ATP-binding protein n=1 Tax=Kineosphaera limosa NBRC 100340 TaxID=1184609 RepID=K6VEW1_9MICO|nr:ATP-binding cassette domain-containing protein [Kineosphaera limosa]NYD98946.1 iron complex transport system ATP-binding protein [Kineosphaera limosa]GAB94728.1 putative iron-siderophore ABC transporter ATP-binding protein [Kineosphaera limosa NBRC 100340]
MITLDSVSKSYGSTRVVDRVSLTIPAGGLTSFVGPNGAGKSTLLSMIARLLPPDEGRITLDDLDVTTASGDVLARRLAILRQENHLSIRLTVGDLVEFGRFPHRRGRPRSQRGSGAAADRTQVEAALAYLDLNDLRHRYLDELSGGQRQRAFVAMVLAQDTDYVLLDEPLNNLDMAHSVTMMHLLRRAADELGRTIVLVVHDINFASFYADRIVALRDGGIVADGSPQEFMTAQTLRDVFGLHMPVTHVDGRPLALYHAAAPASTPSLLSA